MVVTTEVKISKEVAIGLPITNCKQMSQSAMYSKTCHAYSVQKL